MPKRTLLEALADDEPNLWIKLAGGERLPAHREVLRWSSAVVKQLPPGDTWDLSGLVVEGRPVTKAVVLAWLAAVYPLADDVEDAAAGGGAPPLADVLAFADAAGMSQAVLRACCERCPLTALLVKIGDNDVALPTDGHSVYRVQGNSRMCASSASAATLLCVDVTAEQAASLGPQIAAQLEPLLFLAYKLRLTELQAQLHAVVHGASVFVGSPLADRGLLEGAVFTDRVMAAADRAQLKAAWIDSVVGQACSFRGSPLLAGLAEGALPSARFKAALARPYLGSPAGTPVDLELDLAAGMMKLYLSSHPARPYMIGSRFVFGSDKVWGARLQQD
ncbi:MAG: hypothetical protein J3K34DRAFT_370689 [Monoraphidium minutum]|nr:MAG: hypothetical protein J3K34DRAFT_370689 [Monoraphidium minutum]